MKYTNLEKLLKEAYEYNGILKIEDLFMQFLINENSDLYYQFQNARSIGKNNSALILELAPILEKFVIELFELNNEIKILNNTLQELETLFYVKKHFVQRKIAKRTSCPENTIETLHEKLAKLGIDATNEINFASVIKQWIEQDNKENLQLAEEYGYLVLKSEKISILFHQPKTLNFNHLIHTDLTDNGKTKAIIDNRNDFNFHEHELSQSKAMDNINYCLICHERNKDSCSKGLKEKNTSIFVHNPLDIPLAGCPLEEKISEMNYAKKNYLNIAALAIAMIDNPMLAATGHRICNECMRSCIYQKQEPVNVPLIETQVLEDVLNLPYGFEIYSLFTRWNPLNFKKPFSSIKQDKSVLVVGLGPAGFTLSHYLLNEGVNIIAIDGLKIEPLPEQISGIKQNGQRVEFEIIKDIKKLFEDLNERPAYGFGGVAEYGITVRWNKNYLKLIRLILERRSNFRMYGSTRIGSNITIEDAKALGFNHISLCLGAGEPKIPLIENIMSKGVRSASDFLMSLQLSGVFKENMPANLEIRLPIVVIGGGLTAIDTATEAMVYYKLQVEKFLKRYEILGDKIFNDMNPEELETAQEFIRHAEQLRLNPGNSSQLIREWGGVSICYRKKLEESTAYKLNYEELEKALTQGIKFIEDIIPEKIELDKYGSCDGIKHKNGLVAAKSVFIAIGTKPNTVINEEYPAIPLHNSYFKYAQKHKFINSKNKSTSTILDITEENITMSFFGDLHPDYHGNVVSAMASAKDGYPSVMDIINKDKNNSPSDIMQRCDSLLLSQVIKVSELADGIIEIIVKSPLAAKNFQPGQFYRLQNYNATAKQIGTSKLLMEPLALTGAEVDEHNGIISMIVLETGGSSNLCRHLEVGEYVSLMGPTGTPTFIPHNENILLIGGGLGNAVLFSIGKAMRKNKCNVLYFAGYRDKNKVFKREDIEAAADQVIWTCDNGILPTYRKQDASFKGNILEAIKAYKNNEIKPKIFDFDKIDRIMVIGSDSLMSAVKDSLLGEFRNIFPPEVVVIGSINSPMQCMMKKICAQCLQKHINPITGAESYVYSCSEQDQLLNQVDFNNLKDRLRQNSTQEKVCNQWLALLLTCHPNV